MRAGLQFDAVIGAEDILAVGALKACAAEGLSVPRDVAVVGFNNSVLAQCCTPELTSVDNKVQALCTTAVRVLLDVFEGREVSAKTVLSTQMVFRESFLPSHSYPKR
jgi:LacI family transcriptional regulator/LacI family asc operon transcriptional repressor